MRERVATHRSLLGLVAGALLVTLVGCAAGPSVDGTELVPALPDDARIVMMPPDIRYHLITAGGNPELHESWTEDAESAFGKAVAEIAALREIEIHVLAREALSEEVLQYEGLHAALGEALIAHVVRAAPLPAKGDNNVSDWTLGPGVQAIRDETGADYALFVHYRENQASGSRLAFAILAAAARATIPTSSEHGFATLVDLDSGDVEWFGILFDDGYEIREQAGANVVAEWLLQELPVGAGSLTGAQDLP